MSDNTKRLTFVRAGGFEQLLIQTGEDLLAAADLDRTLWAALSFPVEGVEFDRRTLRMIDTDGDGRIRHPELVAAIRWLSGLLCDLSVVGRGDLPLDAIDTSSDEGRRLHDAAVAILEYLGKGGTPVVTLEDCIAREESLVRTPFNGDGIVPPSATDDPVLAGWITEIVAATGGVPDMGGVAGVDAPTLERFDAEAGRFLSWIDSRPTCLDTLLTEEGLELLLQDYTALEEKIEDFFLRCRLASYDPRTAEGLDPPLDRVRELASGSLPDRMEEIAALPLSTVSAEGVLDPERGINPAWRAQLSTFFRLVVSRIPEVSLPLTESGWERLKGLLDPYRKWKEGRPDRGGPLVAVDRLREWKDSGVRESLESLIARDQAMAPLVEGVRDVERLVRFCRDLIPLANEMVSFRQFYGGKKGMFQVGSLYLDGRRFDLCTAVDDTARHAVLASLSGIYLLYCECRRGDEKRTIAAAVTDGDSDQLMVGRNGVFFDREGKDWHAVVTRIVDHPISIRQAFWGPYKRIVRMVGEQLQKFAAARAKQAEEKAAAGIVAAGEKGAQGKAPAAPFDVARFAGIFAAIGLAVGALGTAVASIVTGLLKLPFWQIPLVIIGVMLLISGPSMLLAWFKLRQRNLGRLLDAGGWAVNTRARISITFGTSLTGMGKLPPGSTVVLTDPKEGKSNLWSLTALLLAVAAVALILLLRTFPFPLSIRTP